MFQRDCGATTGFSTQIAILEPDARPAGSGNTFIADADHGAAPVGDWGGPWADLHWLTPDHLLVRYAEKSRIFTQNRHVADIRISYQVVPPEPAGTASGSPVEESDLIAGSR